MRLGLLPGILHTCSVHGIPSLDLLTFLFPHTHAVMFEIELINFVDHQAADAYVSLSREDREQATVEQLIAVANVDREVCCQLSNAV